MPLISRNKLDNSVLEKLFSILFETIGKTANRLVFDGMLKSIMSSTEKIMIAKRIAIYYLLLKEIDYKLICDSLKVSAATVFKYRFILENNDMVKNSLDRLIANDSLKEIFEQIYLIIRGPGVPGVNWGQAKRYKTNFERRKIRGI